MIVRARAPLRLGLAGGGTDVSPYCDLHGGFVLNAAIGRYAYAVIKTHKDDVVKFVSTDLSVVSIRPACTSLICDGKLRLHQAVYTHFIKQYNQGEPIPMELISICDTQAGSGLGSSSTLVVAMIRAFVELLNLPLDDYEVAQLAYQIERVDCGLLGGRQDQFSATFGGFNFMEFYSDNRAVINPLRIKNWILCELEASLILYFTGVSRESAKIIADQTTNVESGDEVSLDAMHELKTEALVMKECLLRGDFKGIVDSMVSSWENKKRIAKSVSNPLIEEIYDRAMSCGSLAGKVSGAGGGGFMLFFVPPDRRIEVINSLDSFDGHISSFHFTKHGTQAWRIS